MKQVFLLSWGILIASTSALFAQAPSYSQDSAYLDANDVRAAFNSAGGDISWDLVGNPRYEVPQGSGKNALFAGNIWIGGLDNSGQLRMAGQTYRQSGVDYWPGPVADAYDSSYYAKYSRVWKVNASEVQDHIAMVGQAGYTAPADLLEWPGNGDTANGEPFFLAPYEDVNQNFIYDPDQGDYPLFPGDQVLYMISNDKAYVHSETGGQPLGVDIHMMAYVYDTLSSSAIDQTIFLSYRIVNRSNDGLNDVMTGLWLDFDLGKFNDDYVGCDTMSESFFVYNADSVDDGPAGYGATPPAFGATILNQSLSYFRTYRNDFEDNGNPTTAPEYYGYLKNYWKDSTVLTMGGDGTQGSVPINYAFPGDVADSSQWSEVSANTPPNQDRRGMGSAGPFTLLPGSVLCFDAALVFGRADSGDHLASVPVLLSRIDEVRKFYNGEDHACDFYRLGTVDISPELQQLTIDVFPNPAKSQIWVQMPVRNADIRIVNLQGQQLIHTTTHDTEVFNWGISDWPAGVYLVQVRKEEQSWIGKFVKN